MTEESLYAKFKIEIIHETVYYICTKWSASTQFDNQYRAGFLNRGSAEP
jgi:hypothetical protein